MTPCSVAALDPVELAASKGSATVAVCLPAHDEAATIGSIIDAVRAELVVGAPLVDQIVVLDDASTDATARVARDAGATVLASAEILASAGTRRGKGEAMWKSLAGIDAEIIAWIDADIVDFDTGFITRLVRPLLEDPDCVFVKGHYARPVGDDGLPGGRVTELVARPALSLYHPDLTVFPQPLSGEIAARRSALTGLPFASGYGVDVGLLIDVVRRFGLDRVARADLGIRVHRNRPLAELAPQAFEVLHAILRRAGIALPDVPRLLDPDGVPLTTNIAERPALDSLPGDWS
jgi:glucosyl-3-phosphoglycerate synthase